MPAHLVQIDGYDPVAAAAVTLYASSHDDERVCHLNGQTWWPAIAKLPSLRYDLVDAGFSGRIDTPGSSLSLNVEPWPNFARYALADARLRLWSGEPGDAWASWVLRFDGRVTSQPTTSAGLAEVPFAVDDRWLDTPLLPLYAGTTGAEGPAALKGQPKPLAIGAPRYCSAVPIDPTNLVFQISAYAVEAVDTALERLLARQASVGNYASYAALVAASVPPGNWATATAVGMVRLGALPYGKQSYQVRGDKGGAEGWVRLPGSVIRRLALLAGGTGKTHEASLTDLNISRPWNISWLIREQVTAREAIQRIAASVNAVAGVSWLGQLFAVPLPDLSGAATITLDSGGATLPMVARIEQLPVDPPFWRLAIEAERTEEVHSYEEAAGITVDRGDYVAGESYREGHVVEHQAMRWRYINATPSSGNAPPTLPTSSNSYWEALDPKLAGVAEGAGRNSTKVYKRSATQPATPTGNGIPSGWALKESTAWTPILSSGVTATSNTAFSKTGGTNGVWDVSFRSTEGRTGDVVTSWKPSQTNKNIMVGLNTDPATNNNYTSIDFAVWMASDGNLYISQNGSIGAAVGTYTVLDTIAVRRSGNTVSAEKNGVAIGATATIASATALYLDSSIEGSSGAVNAVWFGPSALYGTDPLWSSTGELDASLTLYGTWSAATAEEDFADVTANSQHSMEVAADQTVRYNYTGTTALSGQLSRTLLNVRKKGNTVVTTDSGTYWSITSSASVTATIDNTNGSSTKGQITLSHPITADGYIDVTSTNGGVTLGPSRILIYRDLEDPPSGGGSGATGFEGSVDLVVTDTSFDASPQVFASGTARTNSSGALSIYIELAYFASGTNSNCTVTVKAQRSTVGAGVWTDWGAGSQTGSAASNGANLYDATEGQLVYSGSFSGGSASTDYDWRLIGYKSGTSSSAFVVGAFNGSQ